MVFRFKATIFVGDDSHYGIAYFAPEGYMWTIENRRNAGVFPYEIP
jgi:hypothetical protein